MSGEKLKLTLDGTTVTLRRDRHGWYVPMADSEPLQNPLIRGEVVRIEGHPVLLTDGEARPNRWGGLRFYVRWRHLTDYPEDT